MQHGLIMCYPIYGTEEHISNDLNEQSHRPTYINLTQIAWWLGTKSLESKSVHTTQFNKSNCNQLMYMSPQQPLQSIQGSFLLNFRLACFLHNKKEHLFVLSLATKLQKQNISSLTYYFMNTREDFEGYNVFRSTLNSAQIVSFASQSCLEQQIHDLLQPLDKMITQ